MRIVYDVLPHEEDEFKTISGPYWTQAMAERLLDTDKLPVLVYYDPVSLRRLPDGWYIVGKPLPEGTIAVGYNQTKTVIQ